MTAQSKRKQKTRNVIGWLTAERFKSAQKRRHLAKTCEKRMYAWVPMQMFWNGWHRAFSRLHLWIENLPNGKATDRKKKMCWRKAVRMAERSKAPDARNYLFEKSDTRVWARVQSPLLSENNSDVMGHKIQLTNSLILKYVWVQTQIRSDKSFEMYDDNCAADYISEFKKLKKEIAQLKNIMADEPQAGKAQRSNAPDCRISLVETSGTPVCAWVQTPLLSENVLNTMRHSLQLTHSVILELHLKTTVQSERKQKTCNVIGWLIAEQFKSAKKRRYPAKTCETRLYA